MEKKEFIKIRKELGFTQYQLSKKLRVTTKTISDYEVGKTKIPYTTQIVMRMLSIVQ